MVNRLRVERADRYAIFVVTFPVLGVNLQLHVFTYALKYPPEINNCFFEFFFKDLFFVESNHHSGVRSSYLPFSFFSGERKK